jgi:acetolactate synthase regulatory subunit
MHLAQRRHRGQRVKNVAHGAQTDHEQAKAGLHVQGSIFAQRRMGKIPLL